ncbi:hypothetical protein R6Q59_014925 [Mikania micrantha]
MASPAFQFLTLLIITYFASRCLATTYTVGDSSGWDISTDVDSWARDKQLCLFQYSSSHSVAEVNRASYQGCNTTNVPQPSSKGNTTFALTKPGDRYFVCGNRLHCYAGMKLHLVVDGKMADGPAAGGPEAEPGGDSSVTPATTTNPCWSKSNNHSSFVPSSVLVVTIGFQLFVFVGFTSFIFKFRHCLSAWSQIGVAISHPVKLVHIANSQLRSDSPSTLLIIFVIAFQFLASVHRLKLLQNKLIPKNDVTAEEIDAIENKNVDTKPFVASVEELEHGKLPPEEILSLPMFKIFNQNGAGSPDFFGNLMTQFTKNPEMMNTVNQLAQQMDGNQDLTSMLTSMGGSSVGGGSGNLDS